METVGATLYASFHRGGEPGRSGILGIINTTTGAVTPTGEMTGSSRPTGGMHFVGGTMYAVSSTGNIDGQLLTVDLNTGAQTLVGNLTLGGVPQQGATALAYADGKMYTVFNQDSNLYSIDLATSALTSEFDLGVELNSLTVIPEPSGFLLLALGAVVADMAYRRRSV